jgi:hypothetical protein
MSWPRCLSNSLAPPGTPFQRSEFRFITFSDLPHFSRLHAVAKRSHCLKRFPLCPVEWGVFLFALFCGTTNRVISLHFPLYLSCIITNAISVTNLTEQYLYFKVENVIKRGYE